MESDDVDAMFAEFNALSTGAKPTTKIADACSWDNQRVIQHLEGLGMPAAVIQKLKDLEVSGEDLVTLTTNELKLDLGITKLQAKKIKRSLGENMEAEEAADEADLKAAKEASVTGVLAPPADLSTADEPTTMAALQVQVTVGRNHAATAPAQAIAIDAALVATWASKIELIAALEKAQVASKLPAAQQRLQYYRQSFNTERQMLEGLIEASEKVGDKFAKLEGGGWFPGKYLLGQKRREAKVAKAGDKVEEVSRKLEAAQLVAEDLGRKVQLQEQEVSKLAAQVQALGDAKRWEENMLQTAFAGNVGDAREYALELEVNSIVPQVEQARRYKVSYAQAFEMVRNARKQLDGASQAFQAAHGMARLDVAQNVFKPRAMRNSPMGLVADVAKHAQSRQGIALCDQAAQNIINAARIIPDMPRINLQQVKGIQHMMFMDIVFDNIITDMRAMRKIQEAMQQVQAMLRDITYVEHWLQGWLDGKIKQDLAALENAYALKKAELDQCRRQLLQSLADARRG